MSLDFVDTPQPPGHERRDPQRSSRGRADVGARLRTLDVTRRRKWEVVLGAVLTSLALATATFAQGPTARPAFNGYDFDDLAILGPVEMVAKGFREPMGVVVAPGGAILVSDRKAGTVFEITDDAVHPLVTATQPDRDRKPHRPGA
jgi:hypothetical protein